MFKGIISLDKKTWVTSVIYKTNKSVIGVIEKGLYLVNPDPTKKMIIKATCFDVKLKAVDANLFTDEQDINKFNTRTHMNIYHLDFIDFTRFFFFY